MSRPRVAVAWPKADYISSLEQAGAEIKFLNADAHPLPAALEDCDGVLLTGGEDVDPREYGERERHATVELAPERDRYELALAREAMARNLPLLAICRGVQVLNVAAGGTLIQDLPSAHPGGLSHSIVQPKNLPAHDVSVTVGSRLATLLGSSLRSDGRVTVNSRHHQAVRDAAPGFVVTAVAPDGVIEAIERPAADFCVGVQWHPENFWRTGEFHTLFDGFVQAAAARHARTTART